MIKDLAEKQMEEARKKALELIKANKEKKHG